MTLTILHPSLSRPRTINHVLHPCPLHVAISPRLSPVDMHTLKAPAKAPRVSFVRKLALRCRQLKSFEKMPFVEKTVLPGATKNLRDSVRDGSDIHVYLSS